MIFEEIAVIVLVAIIVGGSILIWRNLKRPKATNNDLAEAVDAHNKAAAELTAAANELKCERAMLCQIAREMQSNLMLASGQTSCLTPKEEHDLHVEVELGRRREPLQAQMPQRQQIIQH